MQSKPAITLYTDGAAKGNPGPGGYGIVLLCGSLRKEISGGFALTTNNRMELMAVIVGLEAIKWNCADVNVFSDSAYVVNAVNEGWLQKWQKTGWKKVKNVDLWQRFLNVFTRHNVSFTWVKGHADNTLNERCDRLAVGVYESGATLPDDIGYLNSRQV